MTVLQYLNLNPTQTLREAITALRDLEGPEDAAANVTPELLPDLEIHDVIHVLFGCSTDLANEVMAHLWTVFGTTYPVRDMARVNTHQEEQNQPALSRLH
ncbi:MAG: hypothetical protein AAGC93_18060 [Cyanobacteria bacterium P01_F01_bin.53]